MGFSTRGFVKDRRGWYQSKHRKKWQKRNQSRRNFPWSPKEDRALLTLRTKLRRAEGSGEGFSRYSKNDIIWKLAFAHGRSYCAILVRLAILDIKIDRG